MQNDYYTRIEVRWWVNHVLSHKVLLTKGYRLKKNDTHMMDCLIYYGSVVLLSHFDKVLALP